ncbi:S1C family serine protease [Roseixanthobacter pseudopolyaromaticivorans]|uniref:S1C family serine protease n=1 Tax=Xanthobacteraceae TaxID=335928 RepID=UPI00372A7811
MSALWPAPAAARAAKKPEFEVDKIVDTVGSWTIGTSDRLGGCVATGTFEDRTTLWMGFSRPEGKAFFAVSSPRWRSLAVGKTYEVFLTSGVGKIWRGDFTAVQLKGEKGLFEDGLVTDFLVDLTRAGLLAVVFEDKVHAKLTVPGAAAALSAVVACQKEFGAALREPGHAVTNAGAPLPARPESAAGAGGQAAPRAGAAPSGEAKSSGTGFFVSDRGHMLTNSHVVAGCRALTVTQVGETGVPAQVVARDPTNDLALLKVEAKPKDLPALNTRVRVGDNIFVYGFPLSGLLASEGNFTAGTITAAAGLADDTRMMQISAPVQPGNSGGPVLDQKGNVVGVVVSKLDALTVASAVKDVPQNVNFGIKGAIAQNFLDANGIEARMPARDKGLAASAVADLAKSFTARIECR